MELEAKDVVAALVEKAFEKACERIYAMTPSTKATEAYQEIVEEAALWSRGFLQGLINRHWDGRSTPNADGNGNADKRAPPPTPRVSVHRHVAALRAP